MLSKAKHPIANEETLRLAFAGYGRSSEYVKIRRTQLRVTIDLLDNP